MKSVGDKPKMKVDDLSTNNSGGPNQLGFQNNVRFFDVIRCTSGMFVQARLWKQSAPIQGNLQVAGIIPLHRGAHSSKGDQ